MTLTPEQTEKIVRIRAKSTELNDKLKNIVTLSVALNPTMNQDIVNISAEISSYIDHAGMTREKYVTTTQPLKNQRINLIQQNKIINQENDVLKQASQQQYKTDMLIIQHQIDINENELLNTIKTANLQKSMT